MSVALRPVRALQPGDRRALKVGSIVVGSLLIYSLVLRPVFAHMGAGRTELEQQHGLLAREQALVAAAPTLPRVRQNTFRALNGERARLFSGDSVAATGALATFVSELATANGLRLASVEGRAPLTHGNLSHVFAEVRGEGQWRQVLGFVRTVESSAYLVKVVSLRLERQTGRGDVVAISATLGGVALGKP